MSAHRSLALHVVAALCFAAALAPATAGAQVSLRARDGATEHRLLVAGAIGVYFGGPVGLPATAGVGCVVHLRGSSEATLEVESDLHLPGGRCVAAGLPHVTDPSAPSVSFRVERGGRFHTLRTENARSLEEPFADAGAAWRAAASIATTFDDCTHGRASDRWTELQCETGLQISTATGEPFVVVLQFASGPRLDQLCDAFVDEAAFTEARIDETSTVCTRTRALGSWSARADVESALGPCTASSDPRLLVCGAYEVALDDRGAPTLVRRAR